MRGDAETAACLATLPVLETRQVGSALKFGLIAAGEADRALLAQVDALPERARTLMGDLALHSILAEIWAVVAEANRYFAGQEPWALRKSDPARMATVLYVTAEVVRRAAILLQPFMPDSCARLLDLLAVAPDERSFTALSDGNGLEPGRAMPAPQGVFPRYVEAEGQTAS